MWEDPIVAEIRRVREELASQFDFDVAAIFADLRKKQTAVGARLVRRKPKAGAADTASKAGISSSLHPGR
jgi:hypothetical protein